TFSRRDTHLRATTDLLSGDRPLPSQKRGRPSPGSNPEACDPQHKSSATVGKRVDLARKPSRLRVSSPTYTQGLSASGGPVSGVAAGKSREMEAMTCMRLCAATRESTRCTVEYMSLPPSLRSEEH